MRNIAKWFERMFIPNQKNLWKPHIFKPKNLFKLAVVLLVVKFVIFSWVYYFPQTTHFAIITNSKLIEMLNEDRIAQGLKPLTVNQQLVMAAEKKATDMLNENYFAHTSPDGITPWYWMSKVGYKYVAAGENLAKDFTESEYVHQAWMNSPSHRANILNGNYQDVGIAVVEGEIDGKKTTIAVQFFGKSSVKAVATTPTKVVVSEINKNENKIEVPVPETNVKSEEVVLKGPEVFTQMGIRDIIKEPENIAGLTIEKSESWIQKIYLIVLGIISLVLMLSIFINIKVQYPRMILMVLIFIVLIAAITLFNGGAILNSGIDII
ncbi:CAP domain-containing protein [Patescibacteria group bacterium]|nr:CAP domain-containing protein [Patescibacteria group bacterium]